MLPIVAALINAGLGLIGNAVATKGKDFIEEKIGVDISKMLGSEEGKLKLAEIELQQKEMLLKYAAMARDQELASDKLVQDNTDSARKMQIAALGQEDRLSKQFVYYFAGFWSFMSALYIGCITFVAIPQANIRFADTILGFVLGTVVATILNFFFGSSKQSQDKTVTIAEAVKNLK